MPYGHCTKPNRCAAYKKVHAQIGTFDFADMPITIETNAEKTKKLDFYLRLTEIK